MSGLLPHSNFSTFAPLRFQSEGVLSVAQVTKVSFNAIAFVDVDRIEKHLASSGITRRDEKEIQAFDRVYKL